MKLMGKRHEVTSGTEVPNRQQHGVEPQPALLQSPGSLGHPITDSMRYIAIFAAFSMFASTVEYLFPRPVPFFRLGLANLPIIMAFPILDLPALLTLTLLKVLGQALVNGTLASYVFLLSLTGSFTSFFVMYGVYKLFGRHVSYVGVSLAGALGSNSVQALFSVLVIFGKQAWVILPLFYGLGFAAGLIIGVLAEIFSRHSLWFFQVYRLVPQAASRLAMSRWKGVEEEALAAFVNEIEAGDADTSNVTENGAEPASAKGKKARNSKTPAFLQTHLTTPGAFTAGLISMVLYIFVDDPLLRIIQVVILGVLCSLSGKRLLYGYFLFMMASVTFFNILVPQGRVLFQIGSFAVTQGALMTGIYRGSTIIGLVFISLFSIRRDLYIPGRFGTLVGLTLRYFEHIYDFRRGLKLSALAQRADQVLYELSSDPDIEIEPNDRPKRLPTLGDVPIILLISVFMAGPLVYQLLQ